MKEEFWKPCGLNTTTNFYCVACHKTYLIFCALQALAYNRDQTKLVKGTAGKLKTWAIKLLASSKNNNSRDGNYFSIITTTFIVPTLISEK